MQQQMMDTLHSTTLYVATITLLSGKLISWGFLKVSEAVGRLTCRICRSRVCKESLEANDTNHGDAVMQS